jgi:hypothetical protein
MCPIYIGIRTATKNDISANLTKQLAGAQQNSAKELREQEYAVSPFADIST